MLRINAQQQSQQPTAQNRYILVEFKAKESKKLTFSSDRNVYQDETAAGDGCVHLKGTCQSYLEDAVWLQTVYTLSSGLCMG